MITKEQKIFIFCCIIYDVYDNVVVDGQDFTKHIQIIKEGNFNWRLRKTNYIEGVQYNIQMQSTRTNAGVWREENYDAMFDAILDAQRRRPRLGPARVAGVFPSNPRSLSTSRALAARYSAATKQKIYKLNQRSLFFALRPDFTALNYNNV